MPRPTQPLLHTPRIKAGFRLRDLEKFVDDAKAKGFGPDDLITSPGKFQGLRIIPTPTR